MTELIARLENITKEAEKRIKEIGIEKMPLKALKEKTSLQGLEN